MECKPDLEACAIPELPDRIRTHSIDGDYLGLGGCERSISSNHSEITSSSLLRSRGTLLASTWVATEAAAVGLTAMAKHDAAKFHSGAGAFSKFTDDPLREQ